ncbi:hypothetical protein BDY17DRAFT_316389 [Neohortaea acidophila]|uniref:Urease accessory protein UreF n=1 Tax=Neohortaea acidophila TaxID=245834 RepID=A0A6A6PYQ2_9PEZI|nr:uncharacterized protein BDY17DRAFT_316389 [Neohortaea acidophila]KAF2484593.1 hypothetical protein BDY17DRAFT_316389 [Neohortaea acidophila]
MATNGALHALLLLSDSALPLGSFAFSSGLESFLAHHKHNSASHRLQAFDHFLEHSVANIASTAIPYVVSGYHNPDSLEELDNDFDASTPCTVARRASISQGKALLAIWDRALRSSLSPSSSPESQRAGAALTAFSAALKTSKPDALGLQMNAHFPSLFGAVCCALSLPEHEATYLFLLNHAKTLLSAAVRASVLGPYQSQAVLASARLQGWIEASIASTAGGIGGKGGIAVEDAAVTVPPMDLWMGRHELLYSRIFNS